MDSLIGLNLKLSRSYEGVAIAEMVLEWFFGTDLMDCTREKTGDPLNEDLFSKIFEVSEEVRVAVMVAIRKI